MDYEEKISLLSDDDFFTFFSLMKAEPRWVNSAGHHSIQLLGLCHHGEHHSVVFDPSTLKITCFSECGGGMLFHTWVKRVLDLENPQDAKDFVEDWIDGQSINFDERVPRASADFVYKERPYEYKEIDPLPYIGAEEEEKLYSRFDRTKETLERLVWHMQDGIDVKYLQDFGVAYWPERDTIILPHHNKNGEIVGLYERSFRPLRKEVKKNYPDIQYKDLVRFPRAKYVPLLKWDCFEDDEKTSWSFPNTQNLYGLHRAKDAIKESGVAIIFEGAKSVMLAHQYGYHNAVATHTFGANFNHISMLIEAGAKTIILAFDKQYQVREDGDRQWQLYDKKTRGLAEKIKDFVDVYRICDNDGLLDYKDAPIDKGKKSFDTLYNHKEPLVVDGECLEDIVKKSQEEQERLLLQSKRTRRKLTVEEQEAKMKEPLCV